MTDSLADASDSPADEWDDWQDSDYDGAWKEALVEQLPDFLREYFPAMFETIDWDQPVEWLDKEIGQVVGLIGHRNRVVDLLAKVLLRNGDEQWILLHIEIQTSAEEGFEFRLACYNGSLLGLYQKRVVTLAVLADLRENWLPQEDSFDLGGFSSRLRFPVCKLIHRLRGDWQDNKSLPVQLARAQIAALQTAGNPDGRYQAKWKLVKELYEAGYTADELRKLFRLIDWMVRLSRDFNLRFENELTEFEKEKKMPYVTSVERIAEERGEARGESRGIARALLRVLSVGCGTIPEDVQDHVRSLSANTLDELAEAAINLRSVEQLQAWLDEHGATAQ